MKHLFSLFTLLTLYAVKAQVPPEGILPRPVSVQKRNGAVAPVNSATTIRAHAFFEAQGAYLAQAIEKQMGLKLIISNPLAGGRGAGSIIHLIHDTVSISKPEMYTLTATGSDITLRAADVRGIVNGIQTLLQLLPMQQDSYSIPAVFISDYPRFSYRGMHLDVVRHFFPTDYVKKYIDYLAFHKFNTFHWHLTDDQGWRIEMLSYPKLNTIGSWREATLIGHFKDSPARYDSTRYGGYYTRAEIKDIIAYAAVRGINIIPEIDIPGHSRAAIAAYPELGTKPDTTWTVATTWGMYNRQNNVLAPREETFTFLKTVFSEIADLFPSPYIHIGGDECSKIWWKGDAATQRFMKEKGLKNEAALQTYFIEQVAGYLEEKGKKVIGWHEILEGKIDTSAFITNWADDKKAIEAARRGHAVIQSPGKPLYFDHYQSATPGDSLAIHGYNSLEAVYRFEPVPKALAAAGLGHRIAGAQANLWTEYIAYPTKADYAIFPRMTALSEVLWTPAAKKNYTDFLSRIDRYMVPRYQFWNSHYYKEYRK